MNQLSTNIDTKQFIEELTMSLYSRRKQLKLSRVDIANRFGVQAQVIAAWENGGVPSNQYFLLKWMQLLGFEISNFLGNGPSLFRLPIVDTIKWSRGRYQYLYQYSDSPNSVYKSYPLIINTKNYDYQDLFRIEALFDSRHNQMHVCYKLDTSQLLIEQLNHCLNTFIYRNNKEIKNITNFEIIGMNSKTHCLEIGTIFLDERFLSEKSLSTITFFKASPEKQKEIDNEEAIEEEKIDNMNEDEYSEYIEKKLLSTGDYLGENFENETFYFKGAMETMNLYHFKPIYFILDNYLRHGEDALNNLHKNMIDNLKTTNNIKGVSFEYIPFRQPQKKNSSTIDMEYTQHILSFANE